MGAGALGLSLVSLYVFFAYRKRRRLPPTGYGPWWHRLFVLPLWRRKLSKRDYRQSAVLFYEQMLSISAVSLVAEERTVKGSYIGTCVPTRDLPRYIELYRRGRLPVDRLMSGRLEPEEINLGFDRLREGKAVRQVVAF